MSKNLYYIPGFKDDSASYYARDGFLPFNYAETAIPLYSVTNIKQIFGISKRAARRAINKMVKAGIMRRWNNA